MCIFLRSLSGRESTTTDNDTNEFDKHTAECARAMVINENLMLLMRLKLVRDNYWIFIAHTNFADSGLASQSKAQLLVQWLSWRERENLYRSINNCFMTFFYFKINFFRSCCLVSCCLPAAAQYSRYPTLHLLRLLSLSCIATFIRLSASPLNFNRYRWHFVIQFHLSHYMWWHASTRMEIYREKSIGRAPPRRLLFVFVHTNHPIYRST